MRSGSSGGRAVDACLHPAPPPRGARRAHPLTLTPTLTAGLLLGPRRRQAEVVPDRRHADGEAHHRRDEREGDAVLPGALSDDHDRGPGDGGDGVEQQFLWLDSLRIARSGVRTTIFITRPPWFENIEHQLRVGAQI